MARKTDDEKLENIYNAVKENPGKKAGYVARLLGLHRSEVTRSLPALDRKKLYLSEDEEGGLWLFRKGRKHNS